jgi:two-component system, chemotaxis family, sensor kinase CheA
MKLYNIGLLEPRKEDTVVEFLSDNDDIEALAKSLLENIRNSNTEILQIIKSKHEEPEEAFSEAYKKSFFYLGLANIIEVKKLIHIFEIVEFVIDYGRWKLDFSQYSMIYLIELAFEVAQRILQEMLENSSSNIDISDMILECKTYLREPLHKLDVDLGKIHSEESLKTLSDPDTAEIKYDPTIEEEKKLKNFEDKVPSISNNKEAPEVLNFSPEKALLINDFCEEAADNLEESELALVELDRDENPAPLINKIFRAVHTVKGGARLLGIKRIEALAHEMESLLDDLRSSKLSITEYNIDLLMSGNEALSTMVKEVGSLPEINTEINGILRNIIELRNEEYVTADSKKGSLHREYDDVFEELEVLPVNKSSEAINKTPIVEESIRVPANKLDDVLNTASEVFITRIRLQNDIKVLSNEIRNVEKHLLSAKFEIINENIAVIRQKFSELELELIAHSHSFTSNSKDKSLRLVKQISGLLQGEIFEDLKNIPTENRLNLLKVEGIRKQLQKNVDDLEGLSSRMQSGAMSFRMVPISQLFNRFPAQVRELSRKIGKKIKINISGGDTELDKLLINQLSDPLIHIIRNSLDHGIEAVEQRLERGKSEVGELNIRAFYQGSNAVISITDDGAGINKQRVVEKALETGLISNEMVEGLIEKDIFDLIFEPGFSSVKTVNELSGRGVGMDVVKTAISSLQGSIHIESKEGLGTTISMNLPLTLAIVGILLVSENGHQFALPVLNVVEVLSVKPTELKQVGDDSVFNYRGNTLKVNSLSQFFNFSSSSFNKHEFSIIVLTDGDQKLGIIVDEIHGQQDVLIKQFGSLLSKIDYMMGCTILSDSSLVLIVNIWEMMASKLVSPFKSTQTEQIISIKLERAKHKVLVVDDSAIQRNRMSSILNQAGYEVETALDGHDALKKIEMLNLSAFCVDIVMPIMDGFEFIEKLRQLDRYSEAPVFMITGKTTIGSVEQRRLKNLKVMELFEKPVPEEDLLNALDLSCLPILDERK